MLTVFLSSYSTLRTLHSFPTRRSSDLSQAAREGQRQVVDLLRRGAEDARPALCHRALGGGRPVGAGLPRGRLPRRGGDRKSTRLNSSHTVISYAVFCLKKKR